MERKPKKLIIKMRSAQNNPKKTPTVSTLLKHRVKRVQGLKKILKPMRTTAMEKRDPRGSGTEANSDVDVENDEIGQAISSHLAYGSMKLPSECRPEKANIQPQTTAHADQAEIEASPSDNNRELQLQQAELLKKVLQSAAPLTPTITGIPENTTIAASPLLPQTAIQGPPHPKDLITRCQHAPENQTQAQEMPPETPSGMPPALAPNLLELPPEQGTNDDDSVIFVSSTKPETNKLNTDTQSILMELGVSATICQKIADTINGNPNPGKENTLTKDAAIPTAPDANHVDNEPLICGTATTNTRAKRQRQKGSRSKQRRTTIAAPSSVALGQPSTCNCRRTRIALINSAEKLASMLEVVAAKLDGMAADMNITNMVTNPNLIRSPVTSDEEE
ncbi:uncharacterized protein [Drosophila kikkawai]|uniref:Uncharacterized protein isoform X2 n=1 Tax=Drosophila kikkawai TaxID=30033 RepID=A0ABM4GQC6_DROKI